MPAESEWWRHPFRIFQTNIREVDSGLDIERNWHSLMECRSLLAHAVKTVGGGGRKPHGGDEAVAGVRRTSAEGEAPAAGTAEAVGIRALI